MKEILEVMNTTELVVKIRPEKDSGPYGIWTHDLPWPPMTSHDLWIQISYRPEFFSVLIFTTISVVSYLRGLFLYSFLQL